MTNRIVVAIAVVFGASAAQRSWGKETGQAGRQECSIPGHGMLRLEVPVGWKVVCQPLGEPAAANVKLSPATGDEFSLNLTAMWIPQEQRSHLKPDQVKEFVQQLAAVSLPQAVETTAPLEEIKGGSAIGYVFSLTDKSPKPGQCGNGLMAKFWTFISL